MNDNAENVLVILFLTIGCIFGFKYCTNYVTQRECFKICADSECIKACRGIK